MRPLSQRLQLLRERMSASGRLAVMDASVLAQAIALAKRYEEAPVVDLRYEWLGDAVVEGKRVRLVVEGGEG